MNVKRLFEDLNNKLLGYTGKEKIDMALTDLRAISDMSAKLAELIQQEGLSELEGWVESKITKAADYIDAIYRHHVYDGHDCGCGSSARGLDGSEETGLAESQSTCCGRCGHKHVKGTSCPKPFLTGKSHCRNR